MIGVMTAERDLEHVFDKLTMITVTLSNREILDSLLHGCPKFISEFFDVNDHKSVAANVMLAHDAQ